MIAALTLNIAIFVWLILIIFLFDIYFRRRAKVRAERDRLRVENDRLRKALERIDACATSWVANRANMDGLGKIAAEALAGKETP